MNWFAKNILRPCHLALTFLTTLPLPDVGEVQEGEFSRASGFYPLAGYVVGAVLWVVFTLSSALHLPSGVTAALTLSGWLWITGMLHFDGLVDSADAVLSMRSPQRRLEILADVHIGAFGLASGVMALLLKWSLLASASSLPTLWPLWVVPVAARAILLAPMNLFKAARLESLGARSREGFWPVALLLALPTLLLGSWMQVVLVFVGMLLAALLVAKFAAGRLGGGISGDIYGAIIEITEIVGLLVAYIVFR